MFKCHVLNIHNWTNHWCQLAAVKKTRIQANNLGFLGFRQTIWENNFFYKYLGGMFTGNTCKKCARVYKGIPMVYFGTIISICLQCCFLMVYVPAIYLWFCKLLSFSCIGVINYVLLYIRLQKYIWVLHLGWWLPYIENTSWIVYISLQWQL